MSSAEDSSALVLVAGCCCSVCLSLIFGAVAAVEYVLSSALGSSFSRGVCVDSWCGSGRAGNCCSSWLCIIAAAALAEAIGVEATETVMRGELETSATEGSACTVL